MDGESQQQREERLQSLWKQLDRKNKGTLDLAALKQGLAQMNHPLKDADGMIRDMLTACDINHDGQITYDGQEAHLSPSSLLTKPIRCADSRSKSS